MIKIQDGLFLCNCGNPSKKAKGATINTKTGVVLNWWCADCGGAMKLKGKVVCEVKEIKKRG